MDNATVAQKVRSAIPRTAREVIRERNPDGTRRLSDYYVGRQLLGRRYWTAETVVELEYGIRDGKMHGRFCMWHENGALLHKTHYLNGLEHGLSRQYDRSGNLIGTYRMIRGTGIDLWYLGKGRLSEERHCKDGLRHGFERWWRDSRTVFEESHFKQGVEHGIIRRWNRSGILRRGYPQYFVNGNRVTKKQYLQACCADNTLPRFVDSENRPQRKKPKPAL